MRSRSSAEEILMAKTSMGGPRPSTEKNSVRHMSSELRLRADIAKYNPHVSMVPMDDIAWFSLISRMPPTEVLQTSSERSAELR